MHVCKGRRLSACKVSEEYASRMCMYACVCAASVCVCICVCVCMYVQGLKNVRREGCVRERKVEI